MTDGISGVPNIQFAYCYAILTFSQVILPNHTKLKLFKIYLQEPFVIGQR
jgi:hypothetical protein